MVQPCLIPLHKILVLCPGSPSTTQVWRSARAENATMVREKRRLITLPVALVLRVLRERVFECLDDP